jgi:hypothetical protein
MHGKVALTLNHETSVRILAVLADQMVESSKEIAKELTAEIIESQPLLTNGEDDSCKLSQEPNT